VHGIDFLEMRSCYQSCRGILLTGNALYVERLERRLSVPAAQSINKNQIRVDTAVLQKKLIIERINPKPVYIFGSDRTRAMDKMNKVQRIICFLPGIDCGACGAPNCHALAEDMVNGKAKMSDCVFLQQMWEDEGKIQTGKAYRNLEKKWGIDRFKADCNKRGRRNEVSKL
jgi:ArsR family metal-binding transcriptional regulator